jgi:hypothetical protein
VNRVKQKLRTFALRLVNRRVSSAFRSAIGTDDSLPVFIIASRPDYHLAPLAVEHDHKKIKSIVVANGVSGSRLAWLRRECGKAPVIPLRASFGKKNRNFLSHAEVVSTVNAMCRGDYCIQDADCFVTDTHWWSHILENFNNVYATGPFGKPFNDIPGQFPDTFLVRINRKRYIDVCKIFGVGPTITEQPSKAVRRELDNLGISQRWYPDFDKQYYDTLQLFWTAATLSGFEFQLLPGANQEVFHVGGSSYLTTGDIKDPRHWDYWAVNTVYFHLRVLESPRFVEIREDFTRLFQRFESSDQLLSEYPEYLNSGRYQLSTKLLSLLEDRLQTSLDQASNLGSSSQQRN